MAGKQGFASMNEKDQRAIAKKGGEASHGGSFKDRKFASEQGKKGGAKSRRTS